MIKPEIPKLRFAEAAPQVWDALGNLRRTGWVNRKVENPETVQEHTIALRDIAATMDGLSEQERDGLLDMLEVHDWPEAIHGDEVILSVDEQEHKTLHMSKFEKEQAALVSICASLGEKGEEILGLWRRFEAAADPASIFAKQLDKYQAIEKALEYEKAQGMPLFKEFLDYSRAKISHPSLLRRIEGLERQFEAFQAER